MFPTIDMKATGRNIRRLRQGRGLTIAQVQEYFGFTQPQAIYKWQRGDALPTVDNLYALARLLGVTIDDILVACDQDVPFVWKAFYMGRWALTGLRCRE